MTKLISTACSLVAAFSCCIASLAAEYPKKVFDATYDVVTPSSKATLRMTSDGQGHMRTETTSGGMKTITISDYPKLASLTIVESAKMAIKGKLSADSYQGNEASDMKKKNARDLGSKVVAGHPSHGYEYSSVIGNKNYITQVWIGDDIGWMVQSSSKMASGENVTTLKTFSGNPVKETLFVMTPPAGYKVTGI